MVSAALDCHNHDILAGLSGEGDMRMPVKSRALRSSSIASRRRESSRVQREAVESRKRGRPTFWQYFAVVVVVLAALSVIWSQYNVIQQQHAVENAQVAAENAQVSEEFSRAVDQLGSGSPAVRLGGLYTLQHLMRNSSSYETTTVAVISAYVRDNTLGPAAQGNRETDILAAVRILSRLARQFRSLIDLRGANLDHASLINIHLTGADLSFAHLSLADLVGADMSLAHLTGADLSLAHLNSSKLPGAHLYSADLKGTNLAGADLRGANLAYANLKGANLTRANLTGANVSHAQLRGAKLSNADLRGVDLRTTSGLSTNNLKCAQVNQLTRLPAGVVVPGCPVVQPSCRVMPPLLRPEPWCFFFAAIRATP